MGVFNQLPQSLCVSEKRYTLQENDNTQTNADDIQPPGMVSIAPVLDFFDDIHNKVSFPVTQQKKPAFCLKAGPVYFLFLPLTGYFLMYITSFTALTTRSTLGRAACNNVGAYGRGTSADVIRTTGASR